MLLKNRMIHDKSLYLLLLTYFLLKNFTMNIEAKKLSLIERFMKLKQENSILKLETAITEIELNARADDSEEDIQQGKTRLFDDFSKEVKQWMGKKTTK